MKKKPKQEIHYNKVVWVNPTTEPLRKQECLCLNCSRMKPGQEDHCPLAKKLYEACVGGDIALAVTRCASWQPKEK